MTPENKKNIIDKYFNWVDNNFYGLIILGVVLSGFFTLLGELR